MTSFSVKEGVKPEKRGFQPMRKKLGKKFGVVFSLTVVVTDTELRTYIGPPMFNSGAGGDTIPPSRCLTRYGRVTSEGYPTPGT